MKDFIKKYWLLLLIASIVNIPILVLCCIRTDKTATLKGDTTIIEKFVDKDEKRYFNIVSQLANEFPLKGHVIMSAEKIKNELNGRELNYIFLSH